jgi:DNA polymerase III subunit gamma/tau
MAYNVLARKYRSTTFDDLIGQEQVAHTLKKAIELGRVAHAYLFCGARGTGKTSTARILAKCLNCLSHDKPTAKPCNKCDSCKAIAAGEDIDVSEMDAASNTGVDDVRQIISNAHFRPARARFRVYIIDEVHMLSKNAFNALLKTLEEPPEHAKFILATTEPEKVLATILSRCQRYDFRLITSKQIAAHLADICKKEKLSADEESLLLVARSAGGSMRDALSLLERLASGGADRLTAQVAEQLLGLPKAQTVFDLADSIAQSDVARTLTGADAILSSGLSADALVSALAEHLRNLLILRTCPKDTSLVEAPGLNFADLQKQAASFDPVALTQDVTILEELRRHMRQSQSGRALLDATLVRLVMADQFNSIGQLLDRLDGKTPAPIPEKKKPDEPVIPQPPASSSVERQVETRIDRPTPTERAPAAPEPPSNGKISPEQVQKMENDPLVRAVIDEFNARIVRIEPAAAPR